MITYNPNLYFIGY